VAGFEVDGGEEGETFAVGVESPFFVVSSRGFDFAVAVVAVVSAVSVADADPTVVAVRETVVVVFPSIFGFDDAAPPFPPFPFAPFGGDDLRGEDEFAVKYLYLFPFPSPLPPDLEEKNEKARTCCCAACVVIDVDVEASETVGRAVTSRANIWKGIQEVRKRVVETVGLPTFRTLALEEERVTRSQDEPQSIGTTKVLSSRADKQI